MPNDPLDENGGLSLWIIVLLIFVPLFGLVYLYQRSRNRQAIEWSSQQSFEFPLEKVPEPGSVSRHTPVGEEILPSPEATSAPAATKAPLEAEQASAQAESEDTIKENPAAQVRPSPTGESHALDDLQVIEGIGPKIEAIFYGSGIKTYRQIADTPVDHLREVLSVAKMRADPGTWPEQAALAANGRWDELEELQTQLQRGRRVE